MPFSPLPVVFVTLHKLWSAFRSRSRPACVAPSRLFCQIAQYRHFVRVAREFFTFLHFSALWRSSRVVRPCVPPGFPVPCPRARKTSPFLGQPEKPETAARECLHLSAFWCANAGACPRHAPCSGIPAPSCTKKHIALSHVQKLLTLLLRRFPFPLWASRLLSFGMPPG